MVLITRSTMQQYSLIRHCQVLHSQATLPCYRSN